MYNLSIRCARPNGTDPVALHGIEARALGDSDLTVDEMRAVLERPEHVAYLALVDAQAVGFCSTFETASPCGQRLEVDMLGVADEWRCRGIATALVQHAVAESLACGTRIFRSVVAIDNATSRRVFEHCGFSPLPTCFALLTYPIQGLVPQSYLPAGWQEIPWEILSPINPDALASVASYVGLPGYEVVCLMDALEQVVAAGAFLSVHTLAYAGLWIEALWTQGDQATGAIVQSAVERAKRGGYHEVGLLLAEDACSSCSSTLWTFANQGFQRMGAYLIMERHYAI